MNDEPGCRLACVARLNDEIARSYPPTSAITPRVFSSMAANAPCTLGVWSSASSRRISRVPEDVRWTAMCATRTATTSPTASTSAGRCGGGVGRSGLKGRAQAMVENATLPAMPGASSTMASERETMVTIPA